jgi:xylulose-5-phosphate/fructose-6-phosphate phosphoketolase
LRLAERVRCADGELTMYQFDASISSAVESGASLRPTRGAAADGPLSAELLGRMHRYWQAANYLTAGQI